MQYSANTTISPFARFFAALRALFAVRPARAAAVSGYSIYVPGEGLIGDYTTVTEAETALHYLPYSVRQRATIHDADGYCICR